VKPDRQRETTRVLVRKLGQGKEGPEVIARLLESLLSEQPSVEGDVEELARWFAALKEGFAKGSTSFQAAFPRIMTVFRKVVQSRGVDPEAFYARIVETLVFQGDGEDPHSAAVRRSTRERILEAALDVFSEKGFHLATVDEIAERAGLGKGTLYRHFANKETLFNELVRVRLEELETDANAVLDGQDDVLTMITKYLRIYFAFFDRNQRLYRLVVQEGLDVGRQVQDLYVKTVMRRVPLLKRKIYAASQQGKLKDVDFQTVFYGVMGFVHGVIQKWLASDCSYSLVEELPVVVDVLFYGFVMDGGHRVGMEQEEENGQECT
jgi:AcrR family transcriptional regulator